MDPWTNFTIEKSQETTLIIKPLADIDYGPLNELYY
jgi:hypothetical protein